MSLSNVYANQEGTNQNLFYINRRNSPHKTTMGEKLWFQTQYFRELKSKSLILPE